MEGLHSRIVAGCREALGGRGAHLRVVAADRATAFGGAAGVALVGVGEGVVLLLLVPRFHHVRDRAVPAKGPCVRWNFLTSEVEGRGGEREEGSMLREWGEKWGGAVAMMSLSQVHLCPRPEDLALTWRHLSAQPRGGDPGPTSPWSVCLAERGLISCSPNDHWALLFSCKSWILLLPRSP